MPKRDAARVCPPLLARDAGGLCGRGILLDGDCVRVGAKAERAADRQKKSKLHFREFCVHVPQFPDHRYALEEHSAMDEERAADTIAAAKRGKNARKQAAERKEQTKASSTIAAARKGKNARRERKEMSDGAVRIQSQYRGRQSRARCAETGADQAQRYFTPTEVAKHDRADDLMVSLFSKVLDLSELVRANRGLLVQPLIAAAGTDITHWFDDSTHDPCTYIDPETEIEVPFTPMGRFLHCVPVSCAPPSPAMQPPSLLVSIGCRGP